ncbi:MAG: int [Candidatus Brocadiaceae bacterium]|nr:int [Candidatus Brocadiaceae bacterium]
MGYGGRVSDTGGGKFSEALKQTIKSIEAKLRTELVEGKFFDRLEGERRTFQELMQKFMKEHASKVSENTRVLYGASLKHLSGFFGDMVLFEISSKKITDYKQARKESSGGVPSINRSLSMLSKAFSLCVKEWEWVKENPVLKVSREKENSGRDRWLTGEDEKRLLDNSPQWLKEIILFDLHTGLRQDELLSLQWSRVDLFRKTSSYKRQRTGNPGRCH